MAIHASVAARRGPDGWRAVLLRGASGSGKSDLTLRLLADGWRLVSDDYTEVWASGANLFASAPERIAGLIEARSVGLIPQGALPVAKVVLIVDCIATEPERLPEDDHEIIAGLSLPRLVMNALHASAPAKLKAALNRGDL